MTKTLLSMKEKHELIEALRIFLDNHLSDIIILLCLCVFLLWIFFNVSFDCGSLHVEPNIRINVGAEQEAL